jgi:hypothetical protein
MMKKDRATVVKWTERVDELEDELDVAKAKIESMSGELCHCNRVQEVEATSEGGIPTPALSYEGSNDSYHTPPREGSPHNDSNGENRPPADRLAGIPEGARLVPITSDIDVYEWSEGGDEAAEAAEDALADEERRRYFGVRVLGRRVGRQTCVKSVKQFTTLIVDLQERESSVGSSEKPGPSETNSEEQSALWSGDSQGSVDTSPTQSLDAAREPAMPTPTRWTGPRIVTFLPDTLPDQLQATLSSYGLPPRAVQGGRLVQDSSSLARWSLELTIGLSEFEGEGVLSSLMVDRSESPGWEQGSVENEASWD